MSLHDELLKRFPRLAGLPPGSFVVGGAVRDLLLGLNPADVDVACLDARACAQRISRRVIRLGTEDHLSAFRVIDGEHAYDFADLLDYSITADLARRDFTINAMAVPLATDTPGVLDPHDGRGDLERRLVRMVDEKNFDDDPLRSLKGVRMAVKVGFEMEGETVLAIRKRAARIVEVAAERVTYELSVIFAAGRFRRAVDLLRDTGLDVPLFGGIKGAFHADDVSVAGAFALLVGDPKPYAHRWRWSSDLLREVTAIQRLVERPDLMALYDAGEKTTRQLPAVLRAIGRNDDVAMPDFTARSLLSGDEIASLLSLDQGPDVGRAKRALLEAQIGGEVRSREGAVAFVKRWHVA